jgi:hypothetical protein
MPQYRWRRDKNRYARHSREIDQHSVEFVRGHRIADAFFRVLRRFANGSTDIGKFRLRRRRKVRDITVNILRFRSHIRQDELFSGNYQLSTINYPLNQIEPHFLQLIVNSG